MLWALCKEAPGCSDYMPFHMQSLTIVLQLSPFEQLLRKYDVLSTVHRGESWVQRSYAIPHTAAD